MSSEIEIAHNKRLPHLKLVGLAVLLVAAGIAASGIVSRLHAHTQLAQWSAEQAVPTVVAAPPSQSAATQPLVLPGHLAAFVNAPIYARVSGYLHAWYADIGTHVKAGQLLGLIDTPDLDQQLEQAKADLQSSIANERLAAVTAARWQKMDQEGSVSQQVTDEKTSDLSAKQATVAANQANVKRLEALESFKRIIAPFDGVVTARTTDIGNLIDAGGGNRPELFAVSDEHRLRVYVNVPQSYASDIKPGLSATLTVPEHPGMTFNATLDNTDDSITQSSGTLLVQLMVDNSSGLLIPGDYTKVKLTLPANSHSMLVPASALIFRQQGLQVAVVDQDGRAELKPVSVKTDLGTQVELDSGLSVTDRVIANPPDSLSAGDRVRVASPSPTLIHRAAVAGHNQTESAHD
ncbi:efflux RND transporter periplasmic adaptor subunit [Paraburkholderia madseniana]|uniref:Efflux RND transporter periplasmic adaptor subunit n=1 Tax=Paraburkholderia madseniana TaxID=2599607 RepID=A0AAP5EZD1_9BURK|nr:MULTISPECIES: efflux RND transporter periplasmic adaptor subunit [Paraburkholderia]MCX4149519.1 efflux RND transporter periplasmic adaptor subunit [Paraburkholderia madseniana]MDN7152455.1 efflux RND transporter periplasmic adaptor subunit [Paraburkholderia sp. WS6]MDQ6411337.1 efflux RND transporter periplasmic adaptor subunit [Paraburkholderia madseniana]